MSKGAFSADNTNINALVQEDKEVDKGLHYQWGFIPRTRSVFNYCRQTFDNGDMSTWVKLVHKAASKFDAPNYRGARVAVTSELNIGQ